MEKMRNKYHWSLEQSLVKVMNVLNEDLEIPDYDRIHSVKSVLYASVEQVGLNIEKLTSIQRSLRELFLIINCLHLAEKQNERSLGKQIIQELYDRYGFIISSLCNSR